MSTKSFYHDVTYRQNAVAGALQSEAHAALVAIFNSYCNRGYSPREVSQLIQSEVRTMELTNVLTNEATRVAQGAAVDSEVGSD